MITAAAAAGALLSLSFWVSLYRVLCAVNGSRSHEWNCRLVTLLHGILAVCITAYIGYVDGPWPFSYPGEGESETPLPPPTIPGNGTPHSGEWLVD